MIEDLQEVSTSLPRIESRMYNILVDGRPHTPLELHGCLHDELGPISNIKAHLSNMRKKLRKRGLDVFFSRGYYTLVRLIRRD